MNVISRLIPGMRRGSVLAAAIAVSTVLLVIVPGAVANAEEGFDSTPSQNQVTERDQLIYQQEELLNTYRCQFSVDTDAVPGGCAVTQPGTPPGEFGGTPTQSEIDQRDNLISQQEQLLNAYRCQFGVDVGAVPGGCAGAQSDTSNSGQGQSTQTTTGQSQGDPQTVEGQSDGNAQTNEDEEEDALGYPCPNQPHLTCIDERPSGDDVTDINVTPGSDGEDSQVTITKDGDADSYEASGYHRSQEDVETTETWQKAVDDATDDEDVVVITGVHYEDSEDVYANKVRVEQEIYARGEPYVVCIPAVYLVLENGTIIDYPENCVVVTPN